MGSGFLASLGPRMTRKVLAGLGVMAAPVAAIHVFFSCPAPSDSASSDVDGRNKSGHDGASGLRAPSRRLFHPPLEGEGRLSIDLGLARDRQELRKSGKPDLRATPGWGDRHSAPINMIHPTPILA